MNKSKDNCTAMIVGKNATIDGSTIIARDEDGYGGINEKLFVVHEAKTTMKNMFQNIMV